MDNYNRNIRFFKKNSEIIYNMILDKRDKFNVGVEKIQGSNNFILKSDKKSCIVHSKYNIDKELESMFKGITLDVDTVIIFGLGSGVSIEYILKKHKCIKKLIIIEPNIHIFKEYMKKKYIPNIIAEFESVSFIINMEKEKAAYMLYDILTNNVYNKYEMVYNISYINIYEKYYEYINNFIIDGMNHRMVNIVTQEMFKYIWPINIFRNLKYNSNLVDNLFGKYKDIPAIIVSAGPSLNKNINLLKKANSKALIVAVGSAIKILNNAGISPNFYFAVDGTKEEKLIFEDINTEETILIYGDKLYHEILPDYNGEKLKMILSMDFINKYIYDKSSIEYVQVKSGFSIANVALEVLLKFGCNKIIFVGQDLCYSNNEEYAKGSWKKEDLNIKGEMHLKTKNIFGEEVYTIPSYLGMKKTFERTIENHKGMTFINATEGGLGIAGSKVKTFQNVLNEDLKEILNIGRIKEIISGIDNENIENKDISKAISIIESELKNTLDVICENIEFLKKIESDEANMEYSIDTYKKNYCGRLESIEFYEEVILMSLNTIIDVFDIKYKKYNHKDFIKKELNKLMEIREFSELIVALIAEFKGEIKLDIVF